MMACVARNPPPVESRSCTLTLATLPNSAWVPSTTAEEQPEVSIRFLEGRVQQSVDGQLTEFICVAEEGPERLRCATPLDVLVWCQMRLASQRSCSLDQLPDDIGLDAEAAQQAIAQVAEEHAQVAGTDEEQRFIDRYAQSSEPLMRRLVVQPDPAQCRLLVLETEASLVDGIWDEQTRTEGMALYVPAPMP